MLQRIIRDLLFKLDPEKAHHIGQQLINMRYCAALSWLNKPIKQNPVGLFGLSFPSSVGLAAGWDKDGRCIDALFRMGFGFVEVGTVTPKPQFGNPKPRLFRVIEKEAIINRMGFNNAGVFALVEQLKKRKVPGVLGVNIGKNKVTPLDQALDDYVACLNAVYPYADYCVVNISSPNTPGLRELQSKQYLAQLLTGIMEARKALKAQYQKPCPLLVKTTIDLPESDYDAFIQAVMDVGVDGLVISNTTIDHSAIENAPFSNEAGGLSGAPIRNRVTQMISEISVRTQHQLPIIGVGGIVSKEDAIAHQKAGASLVQLYTGFVYRGPALLKELLR